MLVNHCKYAYKTNLMIIACTAIAIVTCLLCCLHVRSSHNVPDRALCVRNISYAQFYMTTTTTTTPSKSGNLLFLQNIQIIFDWLAKGSLEHSENGNAAHTNVVLILLNISTMIRSFMASLFIQQNLRIVKCFLYILLGIFVCQCVITSQNPNY